jgi:hypothetical protein
VTFPEHYRPTALEVAAGAVFGVDEQAPELPSAGRNVSPLMALEAAVRPALERSPCLVSFSGGRDSSAVLAVATRVARREGLPLPIPATFRFPGTLHTDESDWQERVLGYLGLEDWIRLDVDDELDCLGPYGQRVLRRTGLIFPQGCHVLVPFLELAGTGSLMTGTGGDEILSWRSRVNDLLSLRTRPRPRDIRSVGVAVAPRRVQRYLAGRRLAFDWEWLTEAAHGEVRRLWAAEANNRPSFSFQLRRLWSSRAFQATMAAMQAISDDAGVLLVNPLSDALFVGLLARDAGRRGFGGRTAAMQAVFTGVLPDEVNARTTKAIFDAPYWSRHSREFVRTWTGAGADPELVKVDVLRDLWQESDAAQALTLLQLKAAWLATHAGELGRNLEEPPARVLETLPASGTAQAPRG